MRATAHGGDREVPERKYSRACRIRDGSQRESKRQLCCRQVAVNPLRSVGRPGTAWNGAGRSLEEFPNGTRQGRVSAKLFVLSLASSIPAASMPFFRGCSTAAVGSTVAASAPSTLHGKLLPTFRAHALNSPRVLPSLHYLVRLPFCLRQGRTDIDTNTLSD